MTAQKEHIKEYLYRQSGIYREVLSEREIAEQFEVTRNHARELLLELVGEGIIERRPRCGYRYVDFQTTSTVSILMLRYMVELEAAAVAMQNAVREDEVRLVLANNALRKAAAEKDHAAYAAADRVFHIALVHASHDNMLIRIFDFLQSTVFRKEAVLKATFRASLGATQKTHEIILRAFLDRDGARLRTILKRHLGYPKLRSRFKELAAPIPTDRELFGASETESPKTKMTYRWETAN